MARQNYGYIKRQKQLQKQKKKEQKLEKRKEGGALSSSEEGTLSLVVAEVRAAMEGLDRDDEIYKLGEHILGSLSDLPEEVCLDLARGFLDRAGKEGPAGEEEIPQAEEPIQE